MDLASVHNKARPMMFINLMGTPGELTAVREIGVELPSPVGSVALEIRSVKLAKEDPGDALLDEKPLVDEFGQWVHADWPGKAKSLEQLKAAWTAEEKSLEAVHSEYCRYGGYPETKAKATGFFRVEKIDGKWWFVDPDGHLFFSAGSDSIGASAVTAVQRSRRAVCRAAPGGSRSAARRPRGRILLHVEPGAPLRAGLERRNGWT